jgi:hypothetical protein
MNRYEGIVFKPRNFRRKSNVRRIRVRDFETALLQVIAVIEYRTADKECAFWIDNQTDIGGWN